MKRTTLKTASLLLLTLLVTSGCSTTNSKYQQSINGNGSNNKPVNQANQNDPFEGFNRKVYAFNDVVDKAIIKPVAQGYNFILPNPVQKGIANFFSNIGEIPNIANDVMQGKVPWALTDTWRLIINTTAGIGGLFNVASKLGLPSHHQDFGLTLAYWGMKPMPFLMIPFLGPSTIRDTIGIPVNWALNPAIFVFNSYIFDDYRGYIITAVDVISIRDSLLPTDKLREESFDPYVFVRDAYLQRRAHLEAKNLGKADNHTEEKEKVGVDLL